MKLTEIGNEVMDRPQRIAIDHAIIERARKMKLSEIGNEVMDRLCGDAGNVEHIELNALLESLPTQQRLEIDGAAGAFGLACLEAGFLAGLKAGRDPLALLVDGLNP